MAEPDFYNENRNRSYPFIHGTVDFGADVMGDDNLGRLPRAAIVDAGFALTAATGVTTGALRSVRLTRIRRTGDTLYFEFTHNGTFHFVSNPLVFTRQVTDPDYTRSFETFELALETSDSASDALDDSYGYTTGCPEQPLWSGFLVTGDLSTLTALLPGDGELLPYYPSESEAVIEPSCLQFIQRLDSLNLANTDRTRVTAPAGCDALEWGDTASLYRAVECLSGHIRIRPGYSVSARMDPTDRALVLAATPGAGAGFPRGDVPLHDAEAPPEGRVLLDGSPCCGDLLRAINGAGGPHVRLIAGPGVTINTVPEDNTVIITVGARDRQNCAPTEEPA